MDVKWESMDLDESEMVHGWGWYNILLTLIKVGQEEDADEMQILKPDWVWDSVCMELRCDMDGSEMQYNGSAWSWNGTWM